MKTKALELYFSQSDIEAIEAAIREEEKISPVEIVPYVIHASSDYEVGYWKVLALSLLFGVGFHSYLPSFILAVVSATFYFFSATFRRIIIGRRTLDRAVWKKAKELFVEQEVFNTRDRTGVLILISMFEREVAVLADSGMYKQIPEIEWKTMSDHLASGMKHFDPTPTLIEAIKTLGQKALKIKFIEPRENPNELADGLRLEGEHS